MFVQLLHLQIDQMFSDSVVRCSDQMTSAFSRKITVSVKPFYILLQ